jgi:hypothetical protein
MNKGSFKKGNIPWNLGKKGIHLSPDTEFKKGEMIGKDHHSWRGGVQVVKNDCVYLNVGANQRVRRPRKVYEDTYGSIPKGWILYHLDRDSHNDDLDNLIAIPRAVLVRINSGRMNANYYEIKKTIEDYERNT